ncbi:T9SS type A sorting domain-containing protein, partial [Crocinitomicaceae bacterium]|nr:T9SS type A sorting domain-containing protein [Crocinitomicaceae bacterium]
DTRVDGGDNIFTGAFAQNDLDASYGEPAKANITAFYEVDEAEKTISIEGDVEILVNTSPGVRIYLAVFEYSTQNNVGGNGEITFEHVMKKMLPGDGGVVMPPMSAGQVYHFEQTYQFNGDYVLPANASNAINHAVEHSVEEFSDLGVAAWVQTLSTREVYNAGYAIPGVVSLANDFNSIVSAKIYPNPATLNAAIAIQSINEQDINIELINGLGQFILTDALNKVKPGRTVHKLNLSGIMAGLYTVRISSSNGLISKRLMID